MKHKTEWYVWIDGEKIPVSEDVYRAYYRPVWRESKRRIVRAKMECSLEMMAAYGSEIADASANVYDLVTAKLRTDKLYSVLDGFTNAECNLITALYLQCKSEREYAAESGIPQKTINDRKKRLLERLRIELNKL